MPLVFQDDGHEPLVTPRGQRFCRRWAPQQPPRALLIWLHGLASHSGWFQDVVESFLEAGILVIAMDHEGHGKNPEFGGSPGYFSSLDGLVDDVLLLIQRETTQSAHAHLPFFVMGWSMSGAILTRIGRHLVHAKDLRSPQGIIMLSPLVDIAPENQPSKVLEWIAPLVVKILPKLGTTPSELANRYRPGYMTQLERMQADPLTYKGRIKACVGWELFKHAKMMREILQNETRIRFSCPLLVVQGDFDRSTNGDAARKFVDLVDAPNDDKQFLFVEDNKQVGHDLLHDPPTTPNTVRSLTEWINQRIQ